MFELALWGRSHATWTRVLTRFAPRMLVTMPTQPFLVFRTRSPTSTFTSASIEVTLHAAMCSGSIPLGESPGAWGAFGQLGVDLKRGAG